MYYNPRSILKRCLKSWMEFTLDPSLVRSLARSFVCFYGCWNWMNAPLNRLSTMWRMCGWIYMEAFKVFAQLFWYTWFYRCLDPESHVYVCVCACVFNSNCDLGTQTFFIYTFFVIRSMQISAIAIPSRSCSRSSEKQLYQSTWHLDAHLQHKTYDSFTCICCRLYTHSMQYSYGIQ